MKRLLSIAVLALVIGLLSGCQVFETKDPCAWDKPIYYDSKVDSISIPTAKRIIQHNEEGIKRCGWKTPEEKAEAKESKSTASDKSGTKTK